MTNKETNIIVSGEVLKKKSEGLYELSIGDKVQKNPIEILIKSSSSTNKVKLNIEVKDKTVVEILENIDIKGELDLEVNILVGIGAEVKYVAIQNTNETIKNTIKRVSKVKRDGKIEWVDIQIGSDTSRSSIESQLLEKNSQTSIYGLFLTNSSQEFDIKHSVKHVGENTKSTLLTNGVLDNTSKVIYKSLIDVEKSAKKTRALQKERNLLLSKNAKITATPELSIRQNDITCSHGTSTSDIDKEVLFYLNSHGLDKGLATRSAVHAHVEPILKHLPKSLHPYIYGCTESKYRYE